MKIVTTTKDIPAKQVVTHEYVCELCQFKTEYEDAANLHYGQNHSFKAKVGDGIFWFDTMEDYETWHKTTYNGDFESSRFIGPEWYVKGYAMASSYGDYDVQYFCLHISEHIDEERKIIADHTERLQALEAIAAKKPL